MASTSHEDKYAHSCTDISRSFLLKKRNVSDKRCREIQNIHYCAQKPFFSAIMLFMRLRGKTW